MQNISMAERISRDLVDLIHENGLEPGDALPSARTLAEERGTTVPTIREALRKLEATGIVTMRHGSGTYVGPSMGKPFLVNPYVREGTFESALELAEARLVIEPEIAAVAAQHRDGASLARLEAAAGNALHDGAADSTAHFHLLLAQASRQPMLAEMVDTLLRLREHERAVIRATYADRHRDHEEHRAIVDAVREGDAAAARALTASHLTHIRNQLRTAIQESRP